MLAVQDVEVRYQGAIIAVRGVSLEVPDRGVVALLGANGAGKTTLLRAIGGLLRFHGGRVTRGTIVFDGKRIDTFDAPRIVHLGIAQVLEGRRLFADLTVDENLRTGALAAHDGAAVRRAYGRVMELFPLLRERHDQPAGYLSGGEQQMLAIGRGLMGRPNCCCSMNHRWVWRRRWCSRSATSSPRSMRAAPLCCSSSRTPRWRSRTPPLATSWRPAASRWPAPPPICSDDEAVRTFYLGLHEGEGHANFGALRTQRPERRWSA